MQANRYTQFLRTRFPSLWRSLRSVKYPLQALGRVESVFTNIYEKNFWEASESRSGPGSTLKETASLRTMLPELLQELQVRTLLDAPCGDFNWMSRIDLSLDSYTGADIVQKIVEDNQRTYGRDDRQFVHLDLLRDPLPRADAILCRDCLVHFGDADIRRAIENFRKSGSTFLITTTYPNKGASQNIIMGEWQPLNLEAAPFNFPAPVALIDEQRLEPDGTNSGKSLAAWKIGDLPKSNR